MKIGILANVCNFDQYLKSYLERFTAFSLEGIGTFSLPDDYRPPFNPQLLSFEFHRYATTNPELIDFISEKTGKSVSVIKGAVDAYIYMIRQMVNIGNPFTLQGIGTLKLSGSGEYSFTALDLTKRRRQRKATSGLVAQETVPKNTNKQVLFIIAVLIVIGIAGVIGWGGYQFITENFVSKPAVKASPPPVSGNAEDKNTGLTDSATTGLDTMKPPLQRHINESEPPFFLFIYETTPSRTRAEKRTSQLKSYGNPAGFDSVAGEGKLLYRLYLKIQTPIHDTAAAKDSVEKFLQKDVKVVSLH